MLQRFVKSPMSPPVETYPLFVLISGMVNLFPDSLTSALPSLQIASDRREPIQDQGASALHGHLLILPSPVLFQTLINIVFLY